jgi:hypothetical protein
MFLGMAKKYVHQIFWFAKCGHQNSVTEIYWAMKKNQSMDQHPLLIK